MGAEIKKKEKKYSYFQEEDILINGRFAQYVDRMWVQNRITPESKFVRLVDLYAVAAIVGLRLEKRLPDSHESDDKRTIGLSQIRGEYQRYLTIFQTIILKDTSMGRTLEEKARMAFDTGPQEESVYRENMELFHSYARGGIEHLYNQFFMRPTGIDDEFTNYRVANMIAFIKDPTPRDQFPFPDNR